jgi:hypothetical protein
LNHCIIGAVLLGGKPDIQGCGKNFAGFAPEKIAKLDKQFRNYGLVLHRRRSHHKGFTVDEFVPVGAFPLKIVRVGKTVVFIFSRYS